MFRTGEKSGSMAKRIASPALQEVITGFFMETVIEKKHSDIGHTPAPTARSVQSKRR
jgi:hypothetical protein